MCYLQDDGAESLGDDVKFAVVVGFVVVPELNEKVVHAKNILIPVATSIERVLTKSLLLLSLLVEVVEVSKTKSMNRVIVTWVTWMMLMMLPQMFPQKSRNESELRASGEKGFFSSSFLSHKNHFLSLFLYILSLEM